MLCILPYHCRLCEWQSPLCNTSAASVRRKVYASGRAPRAPTAHPRRQVGMAAKRAGAARRWTKRNAKYFHCGSLKTSSVWPVRLHHIRCDKNDTSSCWPLRLNDIQSGCLKTSSFWTVRLDDIHCGSNKTSRLSLLDCASLSLFSLLSALFPPLS